MKIAVYGTLKRGYGNNVLLSNTKFVGEKILDGFRLYNAGFPVARESYGDRIKCEIFEIADNDDKTLQWLDRLEGNGRMYDRTDIDGVSLYVGHPEYWNYNEMDLCPRDKDGVFVWERNW